MKLEDFVAAVDADPELEGHSVDTVSMSLSVAHPESRTVTTVPVADVESDGFDWDRFREIVLGFSTPIVLEHVTRVVGYFSRVSNWNPSKVGELRDRHKGDYAVEK